MRKLLIILALGAAFVSFLANSGSTVLFDIPHEINYQGMLTDNEDAPLNGNYDILFKIYNHPSSGAMLWDELQEDVLVEAGLFNVVLGSVDPIVLSFYEAERYWLDITVEGEHMPSRVNLASVAFAYRAQTADTALYAAAVTEDYSDDRYVNMVGTDSIRYTGGSGYAFEVKSYASDGIRIWAPYPSAGDGIAIDSAGDNGIEITNVGNTGIYMNDIEYYGMYMTNVGRHGIYMYDVDSFGVYIKVADLGVYVDSTRDNWDGFMVRNSEDDGFYVTHADDDGFYVEGAGDHGVYVGTVGDDGLYVADATDNGIYIASAADYGVWAHGDDGNRLESESASHYGLYVASYLSSSSNAGLYVYGTAHCTGGGWSKSVPGSSGEDAAFAVSSREVELMTSGTGRLVNGQAQVSFEQEFQEAISSEIPVRVVLTAQGAPSGLLYVASKSNQGFSVERLEIPDLAMKSDDITFDWIAIARQKGYEQRPEVLMPSEEELAAEELAELEELKEEQQDLEREAVQLEEMLKQQARHEDERED